MSEALEVIQVPDCPATQRDTEIEVALDLEIKSLWSSHEATKVTAKHKKEELKALRLDLGRKLFERKSILVRTGRGGGWTAYLRSHSLPRATADRYVRAHEVSLIAPNKRTTEAILDLTENDIHRLVAVSSYGCVAC